MALHRKGRQSNVSVEVINDITPKLLLRKEEHFLIQSLSLHKFQLKDCCEKTFSELSTDIDYIKDKSLTDKTFWSNVRQFRITGSRCYSIYTYYQNLKTNSNWETKSSRYFWPKSFTSKFTQHGIKFENIVREMYTKNTGQNVSKCGFLTSKIEKWLGYSPDGIILDSENYPSKLLEIKCPFKGETLDKRQMMDSLNYIVKSDKGIYELKKKHTYYGQVQLGMVMVNVSKCDFVVFSSHSNDYEIIEVLFDKNFTETMLISLKNAYFLKMIHNICLIKK